MYTCIMLWVIYNIGRTKSGHSFRLHPEAVHAVVDDLEIPSNGGVAKVK